MDKSIKCFFLKSSSQILNCYFKGCLSLSQCRALADIDLGICKAIFFSCFFMVTMCEATCVATFYLINPWPLASFVEKI